MLLTISVIGATHIVRLLLQSVGENAKNSSAGISIIKFYIFNSSSFLIMAEDNKSQFKFTWKIKNFLSWVDNRVKVSSPIFKVDFLIPREWNLNIWPNRITGRYGYTLCNLARKRPDTVLQTVFISYKLEFVDLNDHVFNSFSIQNREFKTEDAWGFEMLGHEKLFEKMKTWTEDTLTIWCTITSLENTEKPQRSECEALTIMDVDSLVLKWELSNFAFLDTAETVTLSSLDDASAFKITMSAIDEDVIIKLQMFEEHILKKLFKIKITFYNAICGKFASKCDVHTFESFEPWQFPTFVRKGDFKLANAVTSGQKCTFICEFTSSKGQIVSSFIERYIDNLTFCSDFKPKVKSRNPLQIDFQRLYISKKFSDVKLRAENKECLAHKAVLAARSSVFSTMFDQDMLETQTGVVDIQDMDEGTLKNLIEFMYTETMNDMDCEGALKLLLAADKYQIQTLIEECSSLVLGYLSVENVCEVIAVADMINQENLKSFVLNYIFANATNILASPNWSKWIEKNARLASEILSKLSKYLEHKNTT